MSIINFLFIFFLGKKALMLQGMEPEVLQLAIQYFYVMGYGSIFMIFGIFLIQMHVELNSFLSLHHVLYSQPHLT